VGEAQRSADPPRKRALAREPASRRRPATRSWSEARGRAAPTRRWAATTAVPTSTCGAGWSPARPRSSSSSW